MDIQEEFLFSSPLPTHTTGELIVNKLNEFVRKNDIDWERCCGICSDGAKSMTGHHSGLISRIKEVAPRAMWSHCTIHRQVLAAKKIPPDLQSVLDEAVKIVNLIKARPLNARLFHVLCDELGAALLTAASAHRSPLAVSGQSSITTFWFAWGSTTFSVKCSIPSGTTHEWFELDRKVGLFVGHIRTPQHA